ncbi:transmembrane protein 255B [Meles meles]|uniref:transmembrane protein 255B n=1 Tax=Meles meles TaxID=9662 RepID=UPI001E69FDE7|nr:transmembrane protein 255B [Meles meles]
MQPPAPGPLALLNTTEGFARRKKTSLWFVGSLLVASASILTVGLAATTRTENVTVGGYYPGIILGFGAFLGTIGLNLVENRRQMLVAAIVFISFGVVAAFCCATVDGVFAARHIEPRPLAAGRCQFFAREVGSVHDAYQTEVTCHSSSSSCPLKVQSGSCYCCELYRCQSTEHPPIYYEFAGVRSCRDVLHLYRLLWASAALNVLGALLGVVTAAVLGAFKDMVPLSQLAYGPSAPPRTLRSPAQQILAYVGFCPAPAALPTCSSYPLPLQGDDIPWPRPASEGPRCTSHPFSLPSPDRDPAPQAVRLRSSWATFGDRLRCRHVELSAGRIGPVVTHASPQGWAPHPVRHLLPSDVSHKRGCADRVHPRAGPDLSWEVVLGGGRCWELFGVWVLLGPRADVWGHGVPPQEMRSL